jgi:hypothetical protein
MGRLFALAVLDLARVDAALGLSERAMGESAFLLPPELVARDSISHHNSGSVYDNPTSRHSSSALSGQMLQLQQQQPSSPARVTSLYHAVR